MKQNRDEYQLFAQPKHSLPAYIKAHQDAGDLTLEPEGDNKSVQQTAPSYVEYNREVTDR